MPVQKPPPLVAVLLGLLAVGLGVAGVLALRSASSPMPIKVPPAASAHDTSDRSTSTSTTAAARPTDVPAGAWQTLTRIDEGRWPSSAAAGTHGGEQWQNREARLPRTDPAGRAIRYQEWDVNSAQPGRARDAERIVTGSDGSAWYSGDHYRTFTRMR